MILTVFSSDKISGTGTDANIMFVLPEGGEYNRVRLIHALFPIGASPPSSITVVASGLGITNSYATGGESGSYPLPILGTFEKRVDEEDDEDEIFRTRYELTGRYPPSKITDFSRAVVNIKLFSFSGTAFIPIDDTTGVTNFQLIMEFTHEEE